uniref:hypothetical protein n=1 Tax=Roseovarius sp. BRH_c41 TaxID=1629709 RepID=UPI0025FCDC87|nr:hypothetical protein [Roseovarius sp. BRH_c41]
MFPAVADSDVGLLPRVREEAGPHRRIFHAHGADGFGPPFFDDFCAQLRARLFIPAPTLPHISGDIAHDPLRPHRLRVFVRCASAPAGRVGSVKDAVDPNCTPTKVATGAAMTATVGVGNRCDVGQTARDTAGINGKVDAVKGRNDTNPVKKLKT